MFSTKTIFSCLIAGLIIIFALLPDLSFPLLSLERTKVAEGQIWRLLTSNFVHFGWAHTLMNFAAFLLCAYALLNQLSIRQYLILIIFCCASVGIGVYSFNPEYETYAGLSGAIHGFIVAGLILNKRHHYLFNATFVALLFAKIFYEQQPGYKATELQNLLPVPVAYDAHFYGALAGLLFGLLSLGWHKTTKQ